MHAEGRGRLMPTTVMIISAVLAVGLVIYMLIKKADIKLTLLGTGLALLFIAVAMGNPVAEDTPALLQPFQVIVDQFGKTLSQAGLVILLLGGYAAYMNHIGANAATVDLLTRPLKRVKSPLILVPVVFLLGNLLSIVVPSASNLAIILLATLYPVLRAAGLSTLSSAGVIATTATITPTPLGADNVAVATELAKNPQYADLSVTDYVFTQTAPIAIPTLIVMAIAHFFWQRYMDRRDEKRGYVSPEAVFDESKAVTVDGGPLFRAVYALLPLLPIVLLVGFYVIGAATGVEINLSVQVAVLVCWLIAIVCELVFKRDGKGVLERGAEFFKGMAGAVDIVALLVAASVFVAGLQGIGLIDSLQKAMETATPAGWVLPLLLVGATGLIVILSGSGTALFYAMVPLMYQLATVTGIDPFAVTVPMGMAGNLFRACSPVAAVVVIVAGATHESPINIVKRTWFPMVIGVVFMFVVAMIRYL